VVPPPIQKQSSPPIQKQSSPPIKNLPSSPIQKQSSPPPDEIPPCKNNTLCISIGYNADIIYNFFDKFSNQFIKKIIPSNTKKGQNSTIYTCEFSKNEYTAFATLKLEKYDEENHVDSGFYEACVGYYINKQQKYFPCFVRTYRYGEYIVDSKNIDSLNVIENLPNTLIDGITAGCNNYTTPQIRNAILIECFPNAPSIWHQFHVLSNTLFKYDANFALYLMFFQVYSVLNQLKDEFTHYDLHANNILMYRVKTSEDFGGYIKMIYHTSQTEIFYFYTPFIVKIIDYGHSYFYDSEEFNSSIIYQKVCRVKECDTDEPCGKNRGYNWFDGNNKHHITPTKRNKSHDLWALYYESLPGLTIVGKDDASTYKITQKKVGIPENETQPTDKNIRNVEDAYRILLELCREEILIWNSNNKEHWGTYVGELDVYLYKDENGERIPMKWTPTPDIQL
jgi:hypothetical protein